MYEFSHQEILHPMASHTPDEATGLNRPIAKLLLMFFGTLMHE